MQFWLRTWLAVLLVLSPGALYGLGETTVAPSDDQLVAKADYCVLATITDQRTFVVNDVVFGPLATKELRPRFPWVVRSAQPQEKWILYLEQDYAEIRCLTEGARRVKGTRVETNEIREKPQSVSGDTTLIMSDHPFPTELDQYIKEARDCWKLATTKRRNGQNEALQRVFNTETYLNENGTAPDILYNALWTVHVDDTDTLNRMVALVKDKPESLYMHARGSFVQVIARKNFRAGFDAIRAEAFRRSNEGQNWGSEREALIVLAWSIGTADDVELMKENIIQLSKGNLSIQPHDAFYALGELANRVYTYNSPERQTLRQWLERYCTEPTDMERLRSFHLLATVSLGLLGREESLPLLRRLQKENPGGWNEQAIKRIEQRLKDEAQKPSEPADGKTPEDPQSPH